MALDPQDPYVGTPETDAGFGALVFAASMMVLIGGFQAILGLVAIIDDDFYTIDGINYTYDLDTTGWGWIHLILGILVFCAGVALFARKRWAGYLAIGLAMLSAIANFFFIPYYPFWAIVVIALDVFVIWGLSRPGILVKG